MYGHEKKKEREGKLEVIPTNTSSVGGRKFPGFLNYTAAASRSLHLLGGRGKEELLSSDDGFSWRSNNKFPASAFFFFSFQFYFPSRVGTVFFVFVSRMQLHALCLLWAPCVFFLQGRYCNIILLHRILYAEVSLLMAILERDEFTKMKSIICDSLNTVMVPS